MKRHAESKATYSSFASEMLKLVKQVDSHMHADADAVVEAAGSISSWKHRSERNRQPEWGRSRCGMAGLTYRDVEGLSDLLRGLACSNTETPLLHTEDTGL